MPKQPKAPAGLYTASQAIKKLRMPATTFHNYVRAGKIKKIVPPGRSEGYYEQAYIDEMAQASELFVLQYAAEPAIFSVATPEDALLQDTLYNQEGRLMKETPSDNSDISSLLSIAETATKEAGAYLLQKIGSAKITYQKALHDDLLDADLEAERLILAYLQHETPEIGIFSEEAGRKETNPNYWLIDPLDGSANFQHGSPLFGVAIALILNNITAGSVIYLPARNELFTALKGHGAFLNGQPIRVSDTPALDQAIVHIGDFAKGHDTAAIYEQVKDINGLATRIYRMRMIGTAATDLAYVACGRADLLVNHTTTPWDIEAGKLILLEAGGKATTRRLANRTLAIYSNSLLHREAEEILYSTSNRS
jgi:myo-inositol-1(or 4)-monophosphatase